MWTKLLGKMVDSSRSVSRRCENLGQPTAPARILHGLWLLRSHAVRIGLAGQYGDRRNISAQMRHGNFSSVPALQRGLTPKRRHQDLPSRATRPAADPIFSHLPVPALQRVAELAHCRFHNLTWRKKGPTPFFRNLLNGRVCYARSRYSSKVEDRAG